MEAKTIAVIGAGIMGRGIAYAAALGGYRTVLEDALPERLAQSLAWIKQAFDDARRGEIEASIRSGALALISSAHTVEEAIRDADLIIEAVPDEMEMKLELFTLFDKFAKPGAILASSSTAFSIGEMTDVTTSQDRCIGMRFCDSGACGKLIELVKTPLTSDETIESCREVARRMGKEVIIVEELSATFTTQDTRSSEKAVPEWKT
jgi:3-hydroxybutyryl-CoA dehydrogenase